MKNLKKLIALFAATITVFAFAVAFTGCDFAESMQKNCNHNWVLQRNDSALREATCSKEGVSAVYKCFKCQKYKYEYSPKLPHTFEGSDGVTINCRASKVSIDQTCTVCNEHVLQYLTVEDCHKWVEVAHVESTDEECEHTDYKCAFCHETKTVYNHPVDDPSENASGCGAFGTNCPHCFETVDFYVHIAWEEDEILYSSDEMLVSRYVCRNCGETETRVTYFNN